MTLTYVKTLEQGTSYIAPIRSIYEEKGVVTALFKGANDSFTTSTSVGLAFYAQFGAFHPYSGTLPLRTVQQVAHGPDYVIAIGRYSRVRTDATGTNPFTLADIETAYVPEFHWTYRGTDPSIGILVGTAYWYGEWKTLPVLQLEVRTTLGYSPLGTVFPLVGSVNSDTVTYSQYTIGTNVIRFDGLHQRSRLEGTVGTVAYGLYYRYMLNPRGWNTYGPPLHAQVETASAIYSLATFANAFPVTT